MKILNVIVGARYIYCKACYYSLDTVMGTYDERMVFISIADTKKPTK